MNESINTNKNGITALNKSINDIFTQFSNDVNTLLDNKLDKLVDDEYVKLTDLNTEIEKLQNSINLKSDSTRIDQLETSLTTGITDAKKGIVLVQNNKLDKLVNDEYVKLSNLNDKLSEQQKINDLASLIDTKANSEDVYTITDIDDLLKNKLNTSEINNYPNRTEVNDIKTEFDNSIQAINNILDFENKNSKVYSKEQVDEKISNGFKSFRKKLDLASISEINYLQESMCHSIGTYYYLNNFNQDLSMISNNSIIKISGNLKISKDKISNDSVVETAIGKFEGKIGIHTLGVKLEYIYIYNEKRR